MTDEPRIDFTEDDVRHYLDRCIRAWRKRREEARKPLYPSSSALERCGHYIDAFQSVRTSLFGEVLP